MEEGGPGILAIMEVGEPLDWPENKVQSGLKGR